MSTPSAHTNQNTIKQPPSSSQDVLGQSLTSGFAMALVMWTTWFITHLPWVNMPEQGRIVLVMAAWLLAATAFGTVAAVSTSVGGGVVSAVLGLLILGSKLVEKAAEGPQAGPVKPNAVVIVLGFIALGSLMGLVGWFGGRFVPVPRAERKPDWLARFGIVAAFTVAVLLFIGGLVTSTNSGMAVPDWPRTYGANMFLYPLTGAAADVFLEHSHRLFGTLVGLTTITLLIWVFARENRRWVKICAGIALALVITQGYIGGLRVNANSRVIAMLHGVLGQLTFGLIVAMAAVLSPTFRSPEPSAGLEPLAKPRFLRAMTTGFLHATILQLIFGAMYRHFRDMHSLYAHIAFSMVVVVLGVIAAFAARSVTGKQGGIGPVLRRVGGAIVVVIGFQFVLGWIAFLLGGRDAAAANPGQALIRTIHQANGALALALAVLGFVWARRLIKLHPRG